MAFQKKYPNCIHSYFPLVNRCNISVVVFFANISYVYIYTYLYDRSLAVLCEIFRNAVSFRNQSSMQQKHTEFNDLARVKTFENTINKKENERY